MCGQLAVAPGASFSDCDMHVFGVSKIRRYNLVRKRRFGALQEAMTLEKPARSSGDSSSGSDRLCGCGSNVGDLEPHRALRRNIRPKGEFL